MITVICGVLLFLLLVIFFYYRNSLSKEKENCSIKLSQKDIDCNTKKISYENQLNDKDINYKQQKILYEDKLVQEKTLCNNEKDILNVKLNNIYTNIDNIINNLSDNEKLVYEIENLRQLRAQAQVISSIIPSTASIEEISTKINTIGTNINNKITQRENDTIDPLSKEISNIINNYLSIFIEQQCKKMDDNAYVYEAEGYNEPLYDYNIICEKRDNYCHATIDKNIDRLYNDIIDTRGNYVESYNYCINSGDSCIPRKDLVLKGVKYTRRELDKSFFEQGIYDMEKLRDTLSPEEHKNLATDFLNISNRFFETSDNNNDVIDIVSVFVREFVEFSSLNRPVKINYNKLIKYLRDTKEKFCNPSVPKDYKVYVTNFVDNMYDSYMKIN